MPYKLTMAGSVLSVIGLLIVLATFMIDALSDHILLFAAGAAVAAAGMLLDLSGEVIMSKMFKQNIILHKE